MSEDEEYKNVNLEKIPTLKPVFQKDGTVTAANASTLNDGASALVLMSKAKAEKLGLKPLAKIVSYADAAHAPEWFTTAPSKALPKALDKAGLKTTDIDFFEKHCVQAVCKAGSLLVFNARIHHRTYENMTDRWNHSMTLNACRSFMKQRMDWVRFIPEDVSGRLNAQARRLIGFDTRLPTTLEEFFLPEDQRLYKANQG